MKHYSIFCRYAMLIQVANYTTSFTPYRALQVPPHSPMMMSSQNKKISYHRNNKLLPSSIFNSNDEEQEKKIQYVRPYLKQLFLLCRPTNFPIVTLFHILGVYQAVQLWTVSTTSAARLPSHSLLLSLLREPSMIMVLLSLLLVTSTSMITNDYYDARDGVDSSKDNDGDGEYEHYHPLANGEVPFSIAKTFDSYLYAILLLSSAFVPGVISRLMVIGGAITTYLYTVHLKPKTWIKNLSCASLVAMSPVTSALAAWKVLCDGTFLKGQGVVGMFSTRPPFFYLILKSPICFLVISLFCGIFSREVLMDITDYFGDREAGIETVPVKYGKKYASGVALICSFVSSFSACAAQLVASKQELSMKSLVSTSLLINSGTRKFILALVGSGMMVRRTFSVWKTNGEESKLAERAIRECLVSTVLILASFV